MNGRESMNSGARCMGIAVLCVLAGAASAQTLSGRCYRLLHDATYAVSAAATADAMSRFRSEGCAAELHKRFPPHGIPPDTSPSVDGLASLLSTALGRLPVRDSVVNRTTRSSDYDATFRRVERLPDR
jgi:hypothetical protein